MANESSYPGQMIVDTREVVHELRQLTPMVADLVNDLHEGGIKIKLFGLFTLFTISCDHYPRRYQPYQPIGNPQGSAPPQ